MAKSKKRKKVKRRSKGSASGDKAKHHSGGGGAMMGMRSGFKGLAGSMVGKQSHSKSTRRFVDIFWWVVTIVVGAIAVAVIYNRYVK